MVRVTLWLQLLLVILILRQPAAVSDQCSELQEEEISRLKRDIVSIRDLKIKEELRANITEEHLTKQINISQATSQELNESEAVNSGLKKELELKEEVLKYINEKQTELHTNIDDLTKTVHTINHAVQKLFEKQTQLQTDIDGLTKSVESLNEMSQFLCELPKDVCRSLLEAAKSGDVDSAKRLVKCDSNDKCNEVNEFRKTPLILAASNGHVEVVRVLLEGGANVDRTDAYGSTALHWAAPRGRLDVCRLLLDRGAKVDRLSKWQYTPLHDAALHGHLSVVKLLVEKGADVSVKNVDGKTASDLAWSKGYRDLAAWLVNLKRGAPPMVRVTLWPQLLLVILLLRQSAAVSDHCSELQEEISRLERDIVNITELKHKNELRAGNCTENLTKEIPISEATSKEVNKKEALNNYLTIQLEVKEIVLNSINEKLTQLQTTIDGLTKIVESLNERSQVRCGTPEFVCRSLLDAAKSGDVDSAKKFVKCDANDKCSDDEKDRHTPLVHAAIYGNMGVVRVLLEGGANVDRANAYQATALHWAAWYGHLEVCRLLLDWGAKVDPVNGYLNTPLYWAAWAGRLSVVKLLVERGADVSLENKGGKTASDVALEEGKKDVADWLDSVRRV